MGAVEQMKKTIAAIGIGNVQKIPKRIDVWFLNFGFRQRWRGRPAIVKARGLFDPSHPNSITIHAEDHPEHYNAEWQSGAGTDWFLTLEEAVEGAHIRRAQELSSIAAEIHRLERARVDLQALDFHKGV